MCGNAGVSATNECNSSLFPSHAHVTGPMSSSNDSRGSFANPERIVHFEGGSRNSPLIRTHEEGNVIGSCLLIFVLVLVLCRCLGGDGGSSSAGRLAESGCKWGCGGDTDS